MMTEIHGDHGPGHGVGHVHERGQVHGRAVEERNAATGTIRSIGGTSFVLATDQGELTVITGADTNYHGLSRRQAREAGYQDPTVVNTFAALKVGQRVGVMGERRDDTTLVAERVHIATP